MAAVQQRSPAEPLTPTNPKDANFIASMEDEMRRCAEHLERRQSRKGYKSLDRKANGYSSSKFESGSGSRGNKNSSCLSKGKTLPRSFTMPSDPEERSVLSPRVVPPPGGKSPRLAKSPERSKGHVFKFSSSIDAAPYSRQQQQQQQDEPDQSPGGYYKGTPEASPFFSAGSGSCSRDSSVTPLQSPLGRMPIGAVASHSHSRRSSHSSSPPPAVPPKRQNSNPPVVPPKPANSQPRRAKSHTPTSPSRSHTPHKVTVTSRRRSSLTLSPPPPMDPDLVSKLSAEEDPKKERLEFPSAEVDLKTFHGHVLKAKSLLIASTEQEPEGEGERGCSYGIESSVDAEDYSKPAPPTAEVGTATRNRVGVASVSSGFSITADSRHPETKNRSLDGRVEVKVHSLGTESSVDVVFVDKADEMKASNAPAHVHAVSSDLSLEDPGSYPSSSDPCISERDSEVSADDLNTDGSVGKEGVATGSCKGVDPQAGMNAEEEEVEQKVEELLDKSAELLTPICTSNSILPVAVSPEVKLEDSSQSHGSQRSQRSLDKDAEDVMVNGVGSDDITDEVFSTPPPTTTQSGTIHTDEASEQLEVKSIPQQSRKVANKCGTTSKHSSISVQGPGSPGNNFVLQRNVGSSVDKPLSPEALKLLSSEGVELEGVSESVTLFIKELQILLREKEENLGRLRRQKDREVKEKDEKVKKLTREAKKVEREKWELLKRARDAAERSLHLRTQLDMKEGSLRSIQGELDRTRDELVSVKSANTSLRALLGDLRASRPSVDVGVQVDLNVGSLRRNRSIELAITHGLSQEQLEGELGSMTDVRMSSSSLGLHWDRDGMNLESSSLQDLGRDSSYQPLGSRESRKSKKRGALLGKMMRSSGSKRGSRASITSVEGLDLSQSSLIQGAGNPATNVGSPYHTVSSELKEHWRTLEEAKGTPFAKWGLKTLVAWMEGELGMSQYSRAMADRFPTPSSLLALRESEMEKKLGISNGLHRRKLSLALKEKKAPQMFQSPHASKIDHSWVAFEWAHDCGLAHLTEAVTNHLIDGRVLNTLTKDDLKRYLKITKKVDQMSFLAGVELLRMHDFNREAIQEHRRNSKNPLYWTNRDVADWLHRIDLQDYANNVIGGGIHGALLFLERGRFTSDHLSNTIQIPTSKNQLRRHLAGKMAALFSEDVGSSMDPLFPSGGLAFSHSPLDLSPNNGSQSSLTSTPSGMTTPTDCLHPTRRNSLSRRSMQLSPIHNLTRPLASSPPSFKRAGSTPLSVRNAAAPPQFKRGSQMDSAERARISLRESALRSMQEDTQPHTNQTVTPTVLNSTTV